MILEVRRVESKSGSEIQEKQNQKDKNQRCWMPLFYLRSKAGRGCLEASPVRRLWRESRREQGRQDSDLISNSPHPPVPWDFNDVERTHVSPTADTSSSKATEPYGVCLLLWAILSQADHRSTWTSCKWLEKGFCSYRAVREEQCVLSQGRSSVFQGRCEESPAPVPLEAWFLLAAIKKCRSKSLPKLLNPQITIRTSREQRSANICPQHLILPILRLERPGHICFLPFYYEEKS